MDIKLLNRIVCLIFISLQNKVGLLYDFSATDGDKADIPSLNYSFIVSDLLLPISQRNSN